MAKKKNQDFSKIRVKIGKSKPSNNTTKFNVKTAKVVVPGDSEKKISLKKDEESYLSTEKNDLLKTLNNTALILSDYLGKKNTISQGQRLDITQSVWPTYYYRQWKTPWDNIVLECKDQMGYLYTCLRVVIDNAAGSQETIVNERMVRTVGLYLQLLGDTSLGMHICKYLIEVVKKYMKCVQRGKRLLAIELLSYLAQYCPYSLWYHARRRASIFVLQMLHELFAETKKLYEPLLNETKFLKLASLLIFSTLDGRKGGSIFIGEDWSQIDDIEKPPFNDLLYKDNEKKVAVTIARVTDSKDTWDESVLNKQSTFDLEEYLTGLSSNVLDIGINVLANDFGCHESLEKVVRVVEILNRTCLRSSHSNKWTEFVNSLLKHYPFKNEGTEDDEKMDVDESEEESTTAVLSKKDKKLRKQRLELAAKMRDLCRKAKPLKDVKAVNNFKDELNYQTVALVHQCLVSNKITSSDSLVVWIGRVKTFVAACDWSKNDVMCKWLTLAKQMVQLTLDRSCLAAVPLCNVFVDLSRNLFLTSHSLSRVKRLSLAVFVDACQGFFRMNESDNLPLVDEHLLDVLVNQIVEECDATAVVGKESRHPTFVSTQAHYDVTMPRALYLLLLADYPGVADIVNQMDPERTSVLKRLFLVLRQEMKSSEYPAPQRSWNTFKMEQLRHVPSKFYWDYFTVDEVVRKDGHRLTMAPLCSSVATFMMK